MRNIPHLTEQDLERWRDMPAHVLALQARIDAGYTKNKYLLSSRVGGERMLALIAYVEGDDARFEAHLRHSQALFRAYLANGTPEQRPFLKIQLEEGLCVGLILRDVQMQDLLRALTPEERRVGGWMDDFVDALEALLAGDRAGGEEIARRLHDAWPWKFVKMLALALGGIAAGNMKTFIDALGEASQEFDREARGGDSSGTPDAAVFLRGAALLRLYEALHSVEVPREGLDARLLPYFEPAQSREDDRR
jgi:hypothetical protein